MKDVELLLVLLFIIGGICLLFVYVISWVIFVSYVGVGGLGDFIFNGLNLYDLLMIVIVMVFVIVLVLGVDVLLVLVEKWVVFKGLKVFG